MRKVTYLGKPVDLAGHNQIKKGDELIFTEMEWQYVSGDSSFKLVGFCEPNEENHRFGVSPVQTPMYDLRKIAWNSSRLDRILHRIPLQHLNHIAEAMCSLGLPVKHGYRVEARAIVDSIYKHAVLEGWATMAREEILSAGRSVPSRRKPEIETVAK